MERDGHRHPARPASPPPPAPASAGPGPVGKHREIWACIGLSIITLWICTFAWVWKTQEEVKRRSGDGVGGWLGLVISMVISPVTLFLIPAEIKQM